jgi:hypothetical protein
VAEDVAEEAAEVTEETAEVIAVIEVSATNPIAPAY